MGTRSFTISEHNEQSPTDTLVHDAVFAMNNSIAYFHSSKVNTFGSGLRLQVFTSEH